MVVRKNGHENAPLQGDGAKDKMRSNKGILNRRFLNMPSISFTTTCRPNILLDRTCLTLLWITGLSTIQPERLEHSPLLHRNCTTLRCLETQKKQTAMKEKLPMNYERTRLVAKQIM